MLPHQPAARHAAVAAHFTALVEGVPDWGAPSPVPEWTARGVVEHLTTWLPAFVHSGSPYGWTHRHSAVHDPVAAWQEQRAAVQRLLDDPAQADSPFMHPHAPAGTLGEVIDQLYTTDVFMHSWDLARASGQPAQLDEEHASQLLAGMEPLDEVLRASGQYGPAVPVDDDAGPVERLMAFVGREPNWCP
ncbi:TIGR03086 family protein [Nocardioides sp. Y6]|uniref:TIGR03086 family protein n=1 Tax=Nocardioides malaquae TaxID=2773426 RepID=A0ABR9RU71_9ACTN|nr:TIGR03086 family metal-binding protein [Nocardioides malaquae]MBE7324950.1 TIGR03086 family protein [Nocardioides malaquae]